MLKLVFVMIFAHLASAQTTAQRSNGACTATQKISDAELTPDGVRAYFEKNAKSFKSPGDFVCCLSDEIRSNFLIGHDSFAGQNGTLEHPRIIFYTPLDGKKGATPPASRTRFRSIPAAPPKARTE